MRLALYSLFTLCAVSASAQQSLRQQVRAIAIEAHGKVSVACSLPGSELNCDFNPRAHPPMQSVFKLPLALTILHHVEQRALLLDQPVRFLPQDRIVPHVYSPLQDQYPDAGVDVPLHELLRLAVSLSDNAGAQSSFSCYIDTVKRAPRRVLRSATWPEPLQLFLDRF